MSRIIFLLALLVLASAARAEPEEWVRPYEPDLPGLASRDGPGRATVVSLRVIGATGPDRRVVAGARVTVYRNVCGDPSVVRTPPVLEARTDAFGIVNLTGPDVLEGKALVDAEGYGIVEPFILADTEEVELPPPLARRIRILAPFGGPLARAAVEVFLGCPHSPTARAGVTDERGEIDLDRLPHPYVHLWIRAEGVHAGPYDLPERLLGRDLPELITDPGRTERGVVVDPDGAPVPGVIVRALGYRRGPVTTTDAEGRFVLHGVWWKNSLGFYRASLPFGPRPSAEVGGARDGVPVRLVLRGDRPTTLADGEPRHVVDVVVLDPEGYGERSVPVGLVRLSDGFVAAGESGHAAVVGREQDGRVTLDVPAGRYRVSAGGGFRWWSEVSTEVDLPRPGGEPVRLVCREERATLEVSGVPEPTRGVLRIAGGSRDLTLGPRGVRAWLPHSGPASVVVEEPVRMVIPVPPARDGVRRVEVPEVRPNVVRLRALGAGDRPVTRGSAAVVHHGEAELGPDGRVELRVFASGSQRIRVSPLDPELLPVEMTVELPFEPGSVDLGDVELPSEGSAEHSRVLRLLEADGRALEPHDDVLAAGPGAEILEHRNGLLRWTPTPEPVRIRIEGSARYPTVLTLDSDTPEEIRLPGGRLRGRVVDPEGRPLEPEIYIDAWRFWTWDEPAEPGGFEIRGLPAGPHVLLVGAEGHRGEARRIVLGKDETREIRIVLPPR